MKNKIELSIREITLYTIKRWWIILLCFLLMGGVFAWNSQRKHSLEVSSIQSAYEKAVAEYEKSNENNRVLLADSIKKRDTLSEYLNNSILMRVPPQKVRQSILNISVILDPPSYADTRIVVDHYLAYAKDVNYESFSIESDGAKVDNVYLDELVTVARGQSDLLTITVKGDEEMDTAAFAKAIYNYLLSKQDEVRQNTGVEHTLKIVSASDRFVVDTAIRNLQTVEQRNLTTLQTEINNLTSGMPSAPSFPEYSLPKNLIIGGMMGIAIGILLCVVMYIVVLSVQYTEQIQEQLDIPLLGNLRPSSERNRLTDGRVAAQTDEQALHYAIANVVQTANSAKHVLLTGTVSKEQIAVVVEKIKPALIEKDFHVYSGTSVLFDAETIEKLSQAESVVLVESIDQSRVRQIYQQKERIAQSNKPIIGYFVV